MKSGKCNQISTGLYVAPFAGAWIEIGLNLRNVKILESLPSRERGLKSLLIKPHGRKEKVAPFAGAWIEITQWLETSDIYYRRSLRGSVD